MGLTLVQLLGGRIGTLTIHSADGTRVEMVLHNRRDG